jgi:Uma2 family endonuclease
MAALPDLITVEQFRNLPDDGRRYELHHGEVVCMGRPKRRHYLMQRRLVRIFEAKLPNGWEVGMEFSYRPMPEFDFRAADVAVVSQGRANAIDLDDNLHGAPELVVEIKSPSNTRPDLAETASLCLANGAVQFWVLDVDRVSITVMHRDGTTSVFGRGQGIPLTAFGGESLSVDEIFG